MTQINADFAGVTSLTRRMIATSMFVRVCQCPSVCPCAKSAPVASSAARDGFTLLEAVLALAILSVSVFVLAETTARCLAVIRVSRNYQIARTVFEQGEAMYPITETNRPEDVAAGPKEIIAGFVYQRFEGEAINEDEQLFSVLTRVSWSESGKDSAEEVLRLLYFPKKTVP
ncbi:MAG: hypothetical protein ACOYCD_05080 [Kiritimatiellia bacterium]